VSGSLGGPAWQFTSSGLRVSFGLTGRFNATPGLTTGSQSQMTKKKVKDDAAWWAANFPTAHARAAADKVIDELDPTLPMTTFLDTWIAAYVAAGGRRKVYRD
jgi:hypothetical protein